MNVSSLWPSMVAMICVAMLGGCTNPDDANTYGRRVGTSPFNSFSMREGEGGYEILLGSEIQFHAVEGARYGAIETGGAVPVNPEYVAPRNQAIVSLYRKAGESHWNRMEFWNRSDFWDRSAFWLPDLADGRGPMMGYLDRYLGSLVVRVFEGGAWRKLEERPLSAYQYLESDNLSALVDPQGGLWTLFVTYVRSDISSDVRLPALILSDPERRSHTVLLDKSPNKVDLAWSGGRLWIGFSESFLLPRGGAERDTPVTYYRLAAWEPTDSGISTPSSDIRLAWDSLPGGQAEWTRQRDGEWELFLSDGAQGPAFYLPSEKRFKPLSGLPDSLVADASALRAWNGACMAVAVPPPFEMVYGSGEALRVPFLSSNPLLIATSCGDSIAPLVPAFAFKEDSTHRIEARYRLEWGEEGRLRVLTLGHRHSSTEWNYNGSQILDTEVVLSTWMDTAWTHETVLGTRLSSP